jgi:hypothetical protein
LTKIGAVVASAVVGENGALKAADVANEVLPVVAMI